MNDEASIDALMRRLEDDGVTVETLVNNAGYGAMGPLAELPLDELRLQFETNVFALVAMIQAVVPGMAARGSGRIVNIGSVSGVLPTPFSGAYSASKAAVHALSDALRPELAPFGIHVVTVQPGAIRSQFGATASAGAASRSLSLYEPLADEKGLTLKVDAPEPAPVKGNRELVSQAIANLVDNAIKYAKRDAANSAKAEILITARGDGERILLAVSDHGPGIAQQDRGRVIERFVRLEQSRSEPGSGLGLSLASAVAHLHAGELRLEDNGPGLKAVIALPRARPQALPAS